MVFLPGGLTGRSSTTIKSDALLEHGFICDCQPKRSQMFGRYIRFLFNGRGVLGMPFYYHIDYNYIVLFFNSRGILKLLADHVDLFAG